MGRQGIQYRHWWVRALCCGAIAAGLGRSIGVFSLWDALDFTLYDFALPGGLGNEQPLSEDAAVYILYSLSFALSFFRHERPWLMVLYGTALGATYLAACAVASSMGLLPPVAVAITLIFADATLLETMAWSEEQMRRGEVERLEQKRQQVADMLVHDLRNRLGSMQVALRRIEEADAQATPEMREMLQVLHASTDRLLLQVKSLLDIRRFEEGRARIKRRHVPLGPLLRDVASDFEWAAGQAGVAFDILSPKSQRTAVSVEPELVRRILENLLWNALQFAPPQSCVEISLQASSDGRLGFSVANRGPTIPPEAREKIFEPYSASSQGESARGTGGTGLGLAFCRVAAEAYGGEVQVESPWPDHPDGAQFTVLLPASSGEEP